MSLIIYPSDVSSLSIVAYNSEDSKEILGFIALNTNPSKFPNFDGNNMDHINQQDWDKWISSNYEVEDVKVLNIDFQVYNMAFLSFFCSVQHLGVEILDECFQMLFRIIPMVQMIGYFLPESLILFPPLSSPRSTKEMKFEVNLNRRQTYKFFIDIKALNEKLSCSLVICKRKEYLPKFLIRKARVEDCDDVFLTNLARTYF